MLIRTLPFVPSDPLSLWRELHPNPRHGFFLGSGAGTDSDHLIFFSGGEPTRLILSLSDLEKAIRAKKSKLDLPQLVGFFSFEAGRLFDEGLKRLPKREDLLKIPVLTFGDYPCLVKVDLKKNQTTVAAQNKRDL